MDSLERKRSRWDQTAQDLDDLTSRINAWLACWTRGDPQGHHQTQLETIKAILLAVATTFRSRLQGINPASPSGQLYDDCRKLSAAVVWLERLWEFIRVKLDQRILDPAANAQPGNLLNGKIAALLQAADEVTWSCYRPIIKNLPPGHPAAKRAVVPMTYLEPEYSPAAVQFDRRLPPGLRLTSSDPTLASCLQNIPLPTLRLPPWCIPAPWSLALIGHEVGHHIQHELGLVNDFTSRVGAAARAAGLLDSSACLWEAWSEEIFADACSVFSIGPAAVTAIIELEWSNETTLCQRKDVYPAPAIRIALMTQLATQLQLDVTSLPPLEQWRELVNRSPTLKEDWNVIDRVVDLIRQPLPGDIGCLGTLYEFDPAQFGRRGRTAAWSEALRDIGSLAPRQQTSDARHMASAALSAWNTLVSEADESKRRATLSALATRTPQAILDCAEDGRRAGPGAGADIDSNAALQIATVLLGDPPAQTR